MCAVESKLRGRECLTHLCIGFFSVAGIVMSPWKNLRAGQPSAVASRAGPSSSSAAPTLRTMHVSSRSPLPGCIILATAMRPHLPVAPRRTTFSMSFDGSVNKEAMEAQFDLVCRSVATAVIGAAVR